MMYATSQWFADPSRYGWNGLANYPITNWLVQARASTRVLFAGLSIRNAR